MTAPKKNTTKSKVSPAPATKPIVAAAAKPVVAAAAKPAAPKATPKKKAAAPTAVAAKVAVAPAPAIAPAAKLAVPAPVAANPVAIQPVAHQPAVTTISAKIDIGFGNTLYIRGEGAGLSWDAGVPMDCVGDDLWRISLGESKRGFTFKFLVNDLTWNIGPDLTAASGVSITFEPKF